MMYWIMLFAGTFEKHHINLMHSAHTWGLLMPFVIVFGICAVLAIVAMKLDHES